MLRGSLSVFNAIFSRVTDTMFFPLPCTEAPYEICSVSEIFKIVHVVGWIPKDYIPLLSAQMGC